MNTSLRAYWNVEHPDGGAEWQLRFQLAFLFPKCDRALGSTGRYPDVGPSGEDRETGPAPGELGRQDRIAPAGLHRANRHT
ncbi:MAG: hypothetical protein ACREX4_23670, partial [Gammaproteobacteria bacterium]